MMAPQCSFWLLLIAIIHCVNVLPTANAEKAFVRPNTSVPCPSSSQPCLTFNEYAQEVNQYFVDNTTFLFLPGTHELDVQLDKETRYWTRLLLFVRLFLFVFNAINSELVPIITTSITAVLLALAWLHKGIYEKRYNDFLEAFFIVNLSAATYTYQKNTEVSQVGLAYFFVGIALAALVCIEVFHIYMVLRETALWKKIVPGVKKTFHTWKGRE